MRIVSIYVKKLDPSRNYTHMVHGVDTTDSKIRWGAEQRLEYIEFKLFWEDGVNRSDIRERFGVSVPQASNDLSHYRELAPANIRYDSSEKRYLATPDFKPRFLRPNADRYLVQLKAIADGVISLHDTSIGQHPPADVMPVPTRRVEPGNLKRLLDAIRNGKSVDIYHRSMNALRGGPIWRRVTPHAFGHDGFRWHLRAFCHIDHKFKDFVLSRCLDVGEPDEPGAQAEQDEHWNSFLDVILQPNPAMTEDEQKTIALDYNMPGGRSTVRIRCALLYYFNKRLRLDVAKFIDDPKETPIVVVNDSEFQRALERAKFS